MLIDQSCTTYHHLVCSSGDTCRFYCRVETENFNKGSFALLVSKASKMRPCKPDCVSSPEAFVFSPFGAEFIMKRPHTFGQWKLWKHRTTVTQVENH